MRQAGSPPMKRIINTLSQKWPEYILEIMVITIGILGAFALNNWNENRKQRSEEKFLLANVNEDLAKDSIQFAYYASEFRMIEGLHIQLYRIGIKGEDLDSINEAIYIRRNVYFVQLINKEFEERANSIQNKKVRKELINYIKLVTDLETAYELELRPLINNKIRSYLGEKRLHNTDRWFELKSRVFKTSNSFNEAEGQNILDEERLIELSKDEDFHQILFQLNLKWNEFYSRLLPVIDANITLRTLIQEELANY